jgi:arylsulfatase A-like enzyme
MSQHAPVGREVLPIPDRAHPGLVTYQVSDPDTAFPPIGPLRPPAGAPNVLVMLLDDVGFGASSAFGGPCRMPTAERLAAGGLRYTRFHTTALCSPTRAALLSGRNHHTVGMGGIPEIATSAPGYSSVRPNTCAPLAETLRLNGYSTAQFGKCHEVPLWETSPQGPFDRWPSPGNGMEHFYGFIGGETNQWYPVLYENTVPVQPDRTPEEGYHLMEDLTDRAIGWIQSQQALMGDKPFFVYFAPGATHAPHHVPKEWADRYTGEFDQGWDRLREETFARQKDLGVVPQDCELTRRHQEIPAWDAMPQELIPFLTRQMEVYAGFLSYADHHVGRLIDAIEQLGMLDDTLVYYIIGDNGASPEGTINGTFNEYVTTINLRPELETPEFLAAKLDELGGPGCYNAYAAGWGHALNTPYQWTKQVASHWGGTRNATIVHWPGGIQAKGELRHQFHHVIDVAPTVLVAAGLPEPTVVHGVALEPLHGTSMAYSFDDARAPEQHQTQYFEMVGNRGIYHKGWSAVTLHRRPELAPAPPMEQGFDDDVWEVYDGATDWTQAHDLAKELPDKLHELQRLFLIEAARYQVLPLDDRRAERFDPKVAGRPELIAGAFQMLYPAMRRLSENAVLNLKNKSYSVTAEVVVPDGGAEGVIVAQGGALGGWSLYTKHGVLTYCYNLLSLQRFTIAGTAPLPAGTHQVRAEFAYDGGGLGKGGNLTLHLDGQPAGDGRVDSTEAYTYSFDETTDVGCETGTTVSDDYRAPDSRFNGRINWVRLEAGLDSHDHLIDPEHHTRIAMTRQ